MAAWPGAVTSETEGRLALDTTGEVQRTGAGGHGVGVKEAKEGSARKVPGSSFCKEGGWGCPLRQGSQGSRFTRGQVFVLGQGGDRLQGQQPEQRHREEKGKGNHTRTRGICWNLPESGTVAGLGGLDCRQRGLKPSYSQWGA